jgi:NADPH:quinone reductase-like Zn-dependent oxidoreductase
MKALEIGDGVGLEAVHLVDRPEPTAAHGEVLVRMRAFSLNYRDLLTVLMGAGRHITPFSDGCGVIEALGEGVTKFQVGDRVSTLFFQTWTGGPPTLERVSSALGGGGRGAGAELVALSQDGVIKVPDFLTDNQVATLACAGLTAWRGLFVDASLEPGDTVVLQGTGGVSIFGLQFAKAAGFRTLITSSSDEKLARAKAMGADVTINYRTTPEWSAAVREATGKRGADFVMEVGGAGTLNESIRAIRIGGHIAIIGVLGGFEQPLNVAAIFSSSARLQGLSVGSRDMFEAMNRALDLHKIGPVVDKVYPWTQAREAFAAMQAGEHFGKIVLEVG